MTGETLGKYRLVKLIARGGMGEVWLARQEGVKGFSKTVVVKKILEALAADRNFSEMFVNEARFSALLAHPNIVQVFDLGENGHGLYLAMEYVHGHSLRQIAHALAAKGIAMPPKLAARICQLALLGLAHAHGAVNDAGQPLHLVHRDISPDNILVGYDGSVKVTDFGIAKATAAAGATTTQTGAVKGKVAYMPPEQLKAEKLDGRTDVYAIGVVLYELLSGKRPYVAQTDTSLMLAIIQSDPQPLRELVHGLDPVLERVTMKALEKQPGARFAGAAEMAEALSGAVETDHGAIGRLLVSLFGEESAKPPTTSAVDIPAMGAAAAPPPVVRDPDDIVPTRTSQVATAAPASRPSGLLLLALIPSLILGAGISVVLLKMRDRVEPPPTVVVVEPVKPPPPQPIAPPPPPPEPAPVAEPQQPPAADTAPVARSGRVEIDVVPWGEVFFGKKSLGVTPLDPVTLPAGPQTLTVKNPELKIERKVKVNVPAGGHTRVRVNLMD